MDRIDGELETQPTVDVNKKSTLLYRERLTSDTTLTPESGKRLVIVKIQVLQSPDNETANPVTITMASQINDNNADGAVFDSWVGSDSTEIIGDIDEEAVINLANSNPVSVMINYKQV